MRVSSIPVLFLLSLALALAACADCGGAGEDGADGGADASAVDVGSIDAIADDGAGTDSALGDAAGDDAAGSDATGSDAATSDAANSDAFEPDAARADASESDAAAPAPPGCPPLPAPTGAVVEVGQGDADNLRQIVAQAASGTTILLQDGNYDMSGGDSSHRLSFDTDGVTLRSLSGVREAVVLDGDHVTGELISISASDVTIADITLSRAYYHPIHVTGGSAGDVQGVRIYNVHVIDPGEQAIKINASPGLTYTDYGSVACSRIELTDQGRPEIRNNCYTGGIDAHAARGWQVRRNHIQGFWCASGLSEHGIHFWRSARDTVVEQNVIVDCARGIGFGLGSSGTGSDRAYPDDPYPGIGYVGHFDGVIRNNFIFADISGFDTGISMDQARGAGVYHNTVVAMQTPFNSMEWRFANTDVELVNNLVSHNLMQRDGAQAALSGNIEDAPTSYFVDAAGADLHLDPAAAQAAIDTGVSVAAGLCDDDIDGDVRSGARDIGADEI